MCSPLSVASLFNPKEAAIGMSLETRQYSFISVRQGWLVILVFFTLGLFVGLSFLQSVYFSSWPSLVKLFIPFSVAGIAFRIAFPYLKEPGILYLGVDGFRLRKGNREWDLIWQEIEYFQVLHLNGLSWKIRTKDSTLRIRTNHWFGGEEELQEAVEAWQKSFLASQSGYFQAALKKTNPALFLGLMGFLTAGLIVLVYLAQQKQVSVGASFALGVSLLLSILVAYRRLK